MKTMTLFKQKTAIIFPLAMVLGLIFFSPFLSADTPVTKSSSDDTAKKEVKKDKDKDKKKNPRTEKDRVFHYEVTVTETRTEKDTFEAPQTVNIINSQQLMEKAPNTVTDAMVDLPGVDVNGVGANQTRPVIRGYRGQRILLMEDGIRLNNARRQQDFGEIPAMVDVSEIEKVEVVYGPSSVLYGTDAIAGVINLITRTPLFDPEKSRVHGTLGYRYSSADKQNKEIANLQGNIGKLGFMFGGSVRNAKDYTAPHGTFGNIHLKNDVTVTDTGVKDGGANLRLDYRFNPNSALSMKVEYYNANNAGFGFIEPALYDPDSPRIRIRYPFQTVHRYTFKYENRDSGLFVADDIDVIGYYNTNDRRLTMDIFIPFGIPGKPNIGVGITSENYTAVDTVGFRLELSKAIRNNHILTYGLDFFRDSSENTDYSQTQLMGMGPRQPTIDTTPDVPNALYRGLGVFIQDDIQVLSRASVILGMRYQSNNARTRVTPGLDNMPLFNSTDQTLVGSANFIYGLTDHLRLVFSIGRGFRSPNLIERFFNGVTPEGEGFQSRNIGLKAETSLNIEPGFKYRTRNAFLESSYFNNVIRNGIRLVATGNKVNGLNEYKNINVDRLRMAGFEVYGGYSFPFGMVFTANLTYIKSKDLGNPETPYVDTYSSKLNLNLRYEHPSRFFWVAYHVRINGRQKDILLVDNPIGDIIPGFNVHTVSAGITLFKNTSYPQQVGIIVGNLTNTLYSEFSNSSFFRPQPKRYIVLTWNARF
ncbi:MAG: TonB-dependent receptor plug domain-containing protein [Candidatus Omnitrophota bacterium]